jgi:hypothetical protein
MIYYEKTLSRSGPKLTVVQLSQYYWKSINEVKDFATQWMYKYNHQRPNMAFGGITPKQ